LARALQRGLPPAFAEYCRDLWRRRVYSAPPPRYRTINPLVSIVFTNSSHFTILHMRHNPNRSVSFLVDRIETLLHVEDIKLRLYFMSNGREVSFELRPTDTFSKLRLQPETKLVVRGKLKRSVDAPPLDDEDDLFSEVRASDFPGADLFLVEPLEEGYSYLN
jgi:hypothetical protein